MSSSRPAFNASDGAIVSASHVAQSHDEAAADETVSQETEAQHVETLGLAQAASRVTDKLDDSPDVELTREVATSGTSPAVALDQAIKKISLFTSPEKAPKAPERWSIDTLAGRFLEISSSGETISITAAASLILESQLSGEPAAWVATGNSTFYPPDLAECGVDLNTLPVIRVPNVVSASRATDQLLRSGGFGAIILDIGSHIDMRIHIQARLAALAKKHKTALLCLTSKAAAVPSLGPLVSLRAQGRVRKTGFNRFTWTLDIVKDRRLGHGWSHSEVCRGPDGMC
jgi:recombination protein RecA